MKLWEKKTEASINETVLIGKVINRPYKQVIFGTSGRHGKRGDYDYYLGETPPDNGRLYVYSQTGKQLYVNILERETAYPRFKTGYDVNPYFLHDLNNDGADEIIWVGEKTNWYPGVIGVESFDPRPMRWRYWNAGRINDVKVRQPAGRNAPELIFIASSNDLNYAILLGCLIVNFRSLKMGDLILCYNAPPWLGTRPKQTSNFRHWINPSEKWLINLFSSSAARPCDYRINKLTSEYIEIEVEGGKKAFVNSNIDLFYIQEQDTIFVENSNLRNKYWLAFSALIRSIKDSNDEGISKSKETILENLPQPHYAGAPLMLLFRYLWGQNRHKEAEEVIEQTFSVNPALFSLNYLLDTLLTLNMKKLV
jgi:hypothetical protein